MTAYPSRRTGLRAIRLWFVAALFTALCGSCARDAPPRNVILISIDTLRPDVLGAYGYARPTSPTLDSLAEAGVLFETAYATAPWTLPSHGSLLTGLYPNRHGMKDHSRQLREEVVPWASVMKDQGFRTAAIVNVNWLGGGYGLSRGFDDFVYVHERPDLRARSEVEREAMKWLEQRPPGRFFLFLHFFDVHTDYISLKRYEKMFATPYSGSANGKTSQLGLVRDGKLSFDEEDVRHLLDLYVAGVRQIDDGIARLIGFLEARELLQDTLLIVTSDHGEEFLEHGSVLHGRTQYEEVMRVPLLLRGPRIPAGMRIEEPVSLIDVMPTVLSLLDIAVPKGLDGEDLSPLWRGSAPERLRVRSIFGEADWRNEEDDITRSVRHGDFKLHYNRLTEKSELYDLSRDPGEGRDVQEKHPEVASFLLDRIKTFMRVNELGREMPEMDPEEVERLKELGYF